MSLSSHPRICLNITHQYKLTPEHAIIYYHHHQRQFKTATSPSPPLPQCISTQPSRLSSSWLGPRPRFTGWSSPTPPPPCAGWPPSALQKLRCPSAPYVFPLLYPRFDANTKTRSAASTRPRPPTAAQPPPTSPASATTGPPSSKPPLPASSPPARQKPPMSSPSRARSAPSAPASRSPRP